MRDELLVKARLLTEGLRVEPAALEGLGREYKEQLHHLFEYDFDVHTSHLAPSELRLAGGSCVQVRLNRRSPYVVRRQGDELFVEGWGETLSSLQWIARPAFYSQTTTSGLPMTSIAELVGEDCLSVCHTNACITFADQKECAFCNMNFTPQQYDEVLIRKRAADVGEVMAAAFGPGGPARHFLITGGILPGNKEVEILVAYLEAIRGATGMTDLPGAAIMTPPPDLAELERLRALGLRGVGINLECFDPAYFKAVCPGKEQRIGYRRYREALRAAVAIFGDGGRVFSGFLAGLEPKERLLEGVQELAEEGVASIPLVWSPSAGTLYSGHRPPYAEWYVELSQRIVSIMIRYMKRSSRRQPETVRCVRCQHQSLLHDVLQERLRLIKGLEVA
jgi:hypothetical protein